MDSTMITELRKRKNKVTISKSSQTTTKNVTRYKCLICQKSYTNHSQLNNHTFMSHTNERPYKCTVCGWESKTLAYLKKHQRLHVGEKKFPCYKCPSKFSSWSDRNNHFNKVHDTQWPCKICKRVFSSKNHLSRHNETHSDIKLFICVICDHRSRTLPNLMSHITNLHTQEKPYCCAECSAEYASSSSLKRHVTRAHRPEEWVKNKCCVCDKLFPTQFELTRHMKFHIGEKPFECTVCGSRFVTKSMRNQHALIHNKKFSCNICSKMYPSAFFLKEHLKQHTGEKKFKCEECSNSYFQRGQLNNHVRQAHKKIRPFSCSFCDKSFYRTAQRDKHMTTTHLNEKPYKCTICDKRLNWGLSTHIKQHNQLTDFSCVACPKRFLNRTELLEHHVKKHVGENYNLLTCVFCNLIFSKIELLERHMHRHTQERPYFCSVCNGDFFSKRRLKGHQRKQHGHRR